jgi:hypothetical protein
MAASDGDDVAANLSPAMLRSEMDAFLLTIGAKATPFSVSDMFAGAKQVHVQHGARPGPRRGRLANRLRAGVPFFTPLPRGVSK